MIHLEFLQTSIQIYHKLILEIVELYNLVQIFQQSNHNLPTYINSLVTDFTGGFFKNHYQAFVTKSKDSADILTYIKLNLQQLGGQFESLTTTTNA